MARGIVEIIHPDDPESDGRYASDRDATVVPLGDGLSKVYLKFGGRELEATVGVKRWGDTDRPIKGAETILTDVEDGNTGVMLEEGEITREMRDAFRAVYLFTTGETEEPEDREE